MTIRSYLMFIATQPLLLRLAIVAVAVAVFAAAYAVVELLRAPRRAAPPKSAIPEEPRRVISAACFW